MSERLHYFTEASTPVSFDCSDSDIDSDQDDLFRRPISESDRLKQHARQLQLWSDEARRRRSPALSPPPPSPPSTALSPHRRPSSSVIIHDSIPADFPSPLSTGITSTPTPDFRPRLSADRQQSNLSERARPASRRVSRSHSAKNLRIRITPSSSSKSLLSDIESELGHPVSAVSAPQSPRLIPAPPDSTKRPSVSEKPAPLLPPTVVNISAPLPKETHVPLPVPDRSQPSVFPDRHAAALGPVPVNDAEEKEPADAESSEEDTPRPRLGRKLSFVTRVKRIPSLRKLWRR